MLSTTSTKILVNGKIQTGCKEGEDEHGKDYGKEY
jgi:hypothetical protein